MDKIAATGQRNYRVEIIGYQVQKNSIGEKLDQVEISKGHYWAAMEDKSGREHLDGKIVHITQRDYIIPYQAAIMAEGVELELVDQGRKFDVFHVEPIGRQQLRLKVKIHE